MISQHVIRGAIFTMIVISSALSQETYWSNKSTLSGSAFVGRYNTDNKWGIRVSGSLNGFVHLSYTRSSVLTKERISNFQNEYFMRLYAPQKKRFFFSVGVGYLYQRVSTELWTSFPLVFITEGVGFEGGVHFVTENTNKRRVVVSLSYIYFAPNEELRTPTVRAIDSKLARSLSSDIALVYYLGQIGLVIGPRIAADSDFKNVFFGLHSSLLFGL